MIKLLTIEESYCAMIHFLEELYKRTGSDDLGSLLGDMQINEDDGKSMDPGMWNDWKRITERILAAQK